MRGFCALFLSILDSLNVCFKVVYIQSCCVMILQPDCGRIINTQPFMEEPV
jgi:hypothetical protein